MRGKDGRGRGRGGVTREGRQWKRVRGEGRDVWRRRRTKRSEGEMGGAGRRDE